MTDDAPFPLSRSAEEQALQDRLLGQFLGNAKPNHPDGPLNRNDEGELTVAFAADKQNKVVLVQFGKPVKWFGLPPDAAIKFGEQLIAKAKELQ